MLASLESADQVIASLESADPLADLNLNYAWCNATLNHSNAAKTIQDYPICCLNQDVRKLDVVLPFCQNIFSAFKNNVPNGRFRKWKRQVGLDVSKTVKGRMCMLSYDYIQ